MPDENVNVTMVRENLDHIPDFSLPPGYSLRPYRSGDELVWQRIQAAADQFNTITARLFREQFGMDQEVLAARQLFLCDARDAAVGTSTAWFDDDFRDKTYGRVHWVAIVPDWQGLGLAKPLMTSTCHRLRELGHRRAYLTTSTARIPAISLYLQFGFEPEIDNDDDLNVWQELLGRINKPDILSS
jgi:GNAT superfamily N-acetyltransferase